MFYYSVAQNNRHHATCHNVGNGQREVDSYGSVKIIIIMCKTMIKYTSYCKKALSDPKKETSTKTRENIFLRSTLT